MILKVNLSVVDSKRQIFRVIEVGSGMSLEIFHEAIQMLFEWANAHEHYFKTPQGVTIENEPSEKLGDILQEYGSIDYFYDLSESWNIKCTLIGQKEGNSNERPLCIDGRFNSPREDAGGIVGYDTALEYIEQHQNGKRQYPLITEWYGEGFNPLHFSVEEVNKRLQNIVL